MNGNGRDKDQEDYSQSRKLDSLHTRMKNLDTTKDDNEDKDQWRIIINGKIKYVFD